MVKNIYYEKIFGRNSEEFFLPIFKVSGAYMILSAILKKIKIVDSNIFDDIIAK